MAAPQISNPNTLGNGQGLGRAPEHLHGKVGSSSSSSTETDQWARDGIVRRTDQDVSVSWTSAVKVDYLKDPFAKLCVTSSEQRRFPIVNIGML